MGQIFDFSEIEKSEKTIRKTCSEFRDALAKGLFTFDEVEKAKSYTFLKVYDDLFHQHSGIDHKTIKIKTLRECAANWNALPYKNPPNTGLQKDHLRKYY